MLLHGGQLRPPLALDAVWNEQNFGEGRGSVGEVVAIDKAAPPKPAAPSPRRRKQGAANQELSGENTIFLMTVSLRRGLYYR